MVTALDGYPFDRLTERYDFRADIGCNWKVFADAFQEYHHVPMLHPQEATPAASNQIQALRNLSSPVRQLVMRI
jgi:glycine betaine catabolism A